MNKTALLQAIEKIIDSRISEAQKGNKRGIERMLLNMKREFLDELPTERQQLEDAWNRGMKQREVELTLTDKVELIPFTFSDYYTTTYKTT